jgi:hypothetical protein
MNDFYQKSLEFLASDLLVEIKNNENGVKNPEKQESDTCGSLDLNLKTFKNKDLNEESKPNKKRKRNDINGIEKNKQTTSKTEKSTKKSKTQFQRKNIK